MYIRAGLKKVSKEAKDLLQKMLVVDPTQRYSASEALDHPWITGNNHHHSNYTISSYYYYCYYCYINSVITIIIIYSTSI